MAARTTRNLASDPGDPGGHAPKSASDTQSSAWAVTGLGLRAEVRVSGDREDRIEQIATRQRGRVARRELREAGFDYDAIARRVRRGRLEERLPGVYAVHRVPVAWSDETAALLALRPGSLLSHGTAAALWGLCRRPRQVHVTIEVNSSPAVRGVRVHRTRPFEREDVRIEQALPVTSPARTLLDCAASTPYRELKRMFAEALALRLVRPADVTCTLQRSRLDPVVASWSPSSTQRSSQAICARTPSAVCTRSSPSPACPGRRRTSSCTASPPSLANLRIDGGVLHWTHDGAPRQATLK